MGKIGKTFALILTVIIAMSCPTLLLAKPASAQIIPTPSVPQFTLQYANNSFTVQPRTVTTTNPYTGKQTTINVMGMYVQNESIYVIIFNQHFTLYVDSSGNMVKLFYDVRWRGHFGSTWDSLLPYYLAVQDNSSQYTEIPLGFGGNTYGGGVAGIVPNPEAGDEIDFQVEAYIGYYASFGNQTYQNFTGQTSGWSNIQTITIPESNTSPTHSPAPISTPAVPELSWLAIVPLLLSVFSVAVIIRHRKTC